MPQHAVDERHELAQTLRQTQPEAPTLCGEWDAAHLGAHLVLRERSVSEFGGRLPVAALQRRAASSVDRLVAAWPYSDIVDAVRSGPSWKDTLGAVPTAWLWSIPAVRERANLLEYFVHHEDVRRAGAGWEPRPLPADRQQAIWRQLALMSRLTLRKVPVRLVLSWPSRGEIKAGSSKVSSTVTVTGDPGELTLLAFGRGQVAKLDYDGTAADLETVCGADISL